MLVRYEPHHLLRGVMLLSLALLLHACAAPGRKVDTAAPEAAMSGDPDARPFESPGELLAERARLEAQLTSLREASEARPGELARVHYRLGVILRTLDDLTGSETHLVRAVQLERERSSPRGAEVARALKMLGATLHDQGDLVGAQTALDEALTIQRQSPDVSVTDLAATLNDLGVVHLSRGDTEAAREHFSAAIDALQQRLGPKHPSTLLGVQNLAVVLQELGQLEAAQDLYERALAGRRITPLRRALLLHNLASVVRVQSDRHGTTEGYERAHRLYTEAGSIRRRRLGAFHPMTIRTISHIGALWWARGARDRAVPILEGAWDAQLDHLRRHLAAARSDRKLLAMATDGRTLADSLITLHDADPMDEAAWKIVLDIQGIGSRHEQAARDLTRLEEAAAPGVAPLLESWREKMHRRLLWTQLGGDRRDEDVAQLDTEIEELERQLTRKSSAFAARRDALAARPEDVCAALRARGAGLVDYLRYERYAPRAPDREARWTTSYLAFAVTPHEKEGCRVRRYELGAAEALEDQIDAWRDGLADIERQWTAGAGLPVAFWNEGSKGGTLVPPALRRAMETLDRRGAALHAAIWAPLDAQLGDLEKIYVVPDGRLHEVSLAALPEAEDRYLLERRALTYLPFPAALARTRAPVAQAKSSGADSGPGALVVGDLDYRSRHPSPEEALSGWKVCGTGKCEAATELLDSLTKGAAVARAEGASRDDEPSEQTTASDDGAATSTLSAPSTRVCGWSAVHRWKSLDTDAASIARRIQSSLGDRRPSLLVTGGAAHEGALRRMMPEASILHLATHGFYAPKEGCASSIDKTLDHGFGGGDSLSVPYVDPMRLSALIFSGANRAHSVDDEASDGVLTARDIVGLDLRATRLTVLAACETGRGDLVAGEGAQGLARAFLVAGSREVVASLWQVPDRGTSRLFAHFYDALGDERQTAEARDAVRSAQRQMVAELRERGLAHSAFLWGAFVPMRQAP
jgi:tetratricopeptide (TPR) repeat protein